MADVMMPRLGVSVTEGTLSIWLKQVGDEVAVGDPICEVSTDKVDTEIESTVAGILAEQRYAEGEVVPVGEPLAVVTADGSLRASTTAPVPALGGSVQPVRPANPGCGPFDHATAVARLLAESAFPERPAVSPAARHLAAALCVDLATTVGTGGGGHITRADVERRATSCSKPKPEPSVATQTTASKPEPEPDSSGLPGGYEDVPYELVSPSRTRGAIAEHMVRSLRTSAHMTTEVDVDLSQLADVRASLNGQRQRAGQAKLSFLPFIARATCAALLDYPDLNATFEPGRLLRWGQVNLGIAVDTSRGLMVPVIRGAERLTVEPLSQAITDVAALVRAGKANVDTFRAGTFTISNPGSVGAVSAPAIINQPQVGILGMPTIVRRPWLVQLHDGQEAIAIRPIIRLALTFDHRVVDGGDATRCLVDLRRRLESWDVDDYR